MSGSLQICSISDPILDTIKKFRFRKCSTTCAVIFKIVKDSQELVIDDELDDCSIEELRDTLPDHLPRFVLISYRLSHSDGRVSFPLCLVYLSPQGCSPEVKMLYAGSKNNLVKQSGVNKDFEIRDLEELTSEFLESKLVST